MISIGQALKRRAALLSRFRLHWHEIRRWRWLDMPHRSVRGMRNELRIALLAWHLKSKTPFSAPLL